MKFVSRRHCNETRLQGKLGDMTRSCHAACAMFGYVAVRTVFFDDFFTAAATSYSLLARMRVSRNQQQIPGMDCKSVG